ncbi:hypothetical protein GO495_17285 [Chitinophaga oryziterrae]|uniref:Uncharacterized protein n=1 Tax=Chitinophaga oryziterrae TaxID=1031224 RepID=A0A6N8JDJ7_9BACT|nr:hypothetical protein [Chitinophaga oryziterrae]MVT42349.1 hypothetical protein [Chitinophaga oryziterrae]
MKQPLTVVLTRIFTYGFFRMHAGMLLFMFVTFISYCFFINTLGAIPQDWMAYFQQLITITLVSNPLIMCLFFIVCLIYNIKSWQYVSLQLSGTEQQFIYYSSTAMSRRKQFWSWFYMQLLINMPAFIYAVFALFIGLMWHHYVLPLVIFSYLLLLTTISALIYVRLANRFADTPHATVIPGRWKKPLFSLFIYHVFDKRKLTYLISKAFIIMIISIGFVRMPNDLRTSAIAVLLIIMVHALLIYQEHHFEKDYLSFMRNFPYGITRIYFYSILTHIILLLPEFTWLLMAFKPLAGISLLLLGISIAQLLRSICYRNGSSMQAYLPALFVLFLLLFWGIMYGYTLWLIPINFILSFFLFYRGYFRQD